MVVKIGTAALTDGSGRFNRQHFEALAEDLVWAASSRELVVVSSGAIALGMGRLGYPARAKDIPGKQACAAVGQSRLMLAYEEAFARSGLCVAQVLLTHDDVQDQRRHLNAKHALARLMSERGYPSSGDTLSVDELKFGDNDTLAALVAGLVEANALVILPDVEGLYHDDPRSNPDAKLVELVRGVTPEVLSLAGDTGSGMGVGGMASKVRAAAKVTERGILCAITSGRQPGRLCEVLEGKDVGTLFEGQAAS